MKKTFCMLLCICMLLLLAACGGQYPEQEPSGEDKSSVYSESIEDYEVLSLTVAENKDEYPAIVKEPERLFYAYDEKGELYRIIWYWMDDIRQGETVYVTYPKDGTIKQLNYDKDPDAKGFFAKYELDPAWVWSAQAWKLRETADKRVAEEFALPLSKLSCRYYLQNEIYEFTYTLYLGGIYTDARLTLKLNAAGEVTEVDSQNRQYIDFVNTEVEAAIPDAIARMNQEAGKELTHFSFNVDSLGYLNIECEDIVYLEPGDPDYGKGCGDHRHDFYEERVGKLP